MGKASSVGMDGRRRNAQGASSRYKSHLKASAAAKIPEAQPTTQVGKVLPSSTNGVSHLN